MATITIADLATDLNTDARTARKFMRSVTPADSQPGKGSRWAIEKRDLRSLRSKFTKFLEAAAEAPKDADEVAIDPLNRPVEDTTDFDLAMRDADA